MGNTCVNKVGGWDVLKKHFYTEGSGKQHKLGMSAGKYNVHIITTRTFVGIVVGWLVGWKY